jgi:hypothetical protein
VLAGLAEQVLVVDAFEVVPAGAFDRSHGSSFAAESCWRSTLRRGVCVVEDEPAEAQTRLTLSASRPR